MVSFDDLESRIRGLFKEPIIGPIKSKMAKIRHLENLHDVIFFCWGSSDLDKIAQTGAEWHVDCGNMVIIEIRCRLPIRRTFERIPLHVIPEPPATLQGTCCHLANSMSWSQSYVSHCRVLHRANSTTCRPRATYHLAGCCHLVNSLSWFQSHMPHCRVQSPGEINIMIMPHCRV